MTDARNMELLVDALTADDRLDDLGRARIWSRIDDAIAIPVPGRSWNRFGFAAAAACAAIAALVLVRRGDPDRALVVPADATLTTHLGPHTHAALVGPAELRVVDIAGDTATVRLTRGTLLAEFTGGPGRALHVDAPGMRVDVVGTLFAVEITAAATCVSVAHGRVHVTTDGRDASVATGQHLCTHDPMPSAIEPRVEQALARHATITAELSAPAAPAQPERVASAPPPPPAPPPLPEPAIAAPPPPADPDRTSAALSPPTARARAVAALPSRAEPEPAAAPTPAVVRGSPSEPATRRVVATRSPITPSSAAPSTIASGPATAVDPSPPPSPPPPAEAAPPPVAPTPPSAPKPQAAPAPPTPDELYRAAEAALARRDDQAADRALAQLVAIEPSSQLAAQAWYDRARIAYQRHAFADARRDLEALATLGDNPLAESGRYLTCRIAVEERDAGAARCLRELRAAYPSSPHDRDALATLAQLAYGEHGCTAARPYVSDLARRYPHSSLATAWHARCPEQP